MIAAFTDSATSPLTFQGEPYPTALAQSPMNNGAQPSRKEPPACRIYIQGQ
nr:MAG TPA: hypothetical protein [Caudoviricetes sp.]